MEALDAYASEEEDAHEVPAEAPLEATAGDGDDTELEGDERSKADKDAEREAMEKACQDAMGLRATQTVAKPKPSQKARPKERSELPWKQPPAQPPTPREEGKGGNPTGVAAALAREVPRAGSPAQQWANVTSSGGGWMKKMAALVSHYERGDWDG
ncbi:unnamed protein product, partial [Symbiodinium microadriaticum]